MSRNTRPAEREINEGIRKQKSRKGSPVMDAQPTRPTPKSLPKPKPTNRQRKEYHNRADTFVGHVDQVMNPGKIYRDPGKGPSIGRDRVIPAASEVALGFKRFVEDKMDGEKMAYGGKPKSKKVKGKGKSIDGIAQRGKTRASSR